MLYPAELRALANGVQGYADLIRGLAVSLAGARRGGVRRHIVDVMDPDQVRHASPDDEPEGGDPACWAALVCPNCGAIADAAERAGSSVDDVTGGVGGRVRPSVCARCGQPYPLD